MRFTKKIIINASAEKVWDVFAHDFNNAYKWMAAVPYSYAAARIDRVKACLGGAPGFVKFEGAQSSGRICELTTEPYGLKAAEQFLAYDEGRNCTIRIDFVDAPYMFPLRYNVADIEVRQLVSGSEISFAINSHIKPQAYLIWPMIRFGFGGGVKRILEELKYFVENDSPHPRKIKAMEKAMISIY